MPPRWGILGIFYWEEAPDPGLERLYLSTDLACYSSWMRWLGWGKCGLLCSDFYPHDPNLDKRQRINGWMESCRSPWNWLVSPQHLFLNSCLYGLHQMPVYQTRMPIKLSAQELITWIITKANRIRYLSDDTIRSSSYSNTEICAIRHPAFSLTTAHLKSWKLLMMSYHCSLEINRNLQVSREKQIHKTKRKNRHFDR